MLRTLPGIVVCVWCLCVGALAGVGAAEAAPSPPGSIAGTVIDPFGAGIARASVVLIRNGEPAAQTVTDEHGGFEISDVESGRYQLSVSAAGFEPFVTTTFFAGADRTVMNVPLQIGALQQEVVVTAEPTALPASQIGASVTVLDRDTLDALEKPDALEALRLVPGTEVAQTGARGGVTYVYLRGGDSDMAKVLIDGVPANDIGGAFDFSEVATTGLDRVEVLRDANSLLYGTDALTGVISLTTRRGRTESPELSLALDGGSFGTQREDGTVGGVINRFNYFIDASHFDTNNALPNNAYRNDTVATRVGWTFDRNTDLSVTVRHLDSRSGLPNAFDLYGISDETSQTMDATYVSTTLNSQLSQQWQTTLRFASMDQQYRTVNPSPVGEPSDPFDTGCPNYLGNVVTIVGANGYSATGQAILDYCGTYPETYSADTTRRSGYAQLTGHLEPWLDLSAGGRLEHESGFTLSSGASEMSTNRTNAGTFGEARFAQRRVFASAGLGYDYNAVFKSAVTPRVSAAAYLREPSTTAWLADTKLTFNAGSGIKAPSIPQELSSLYDLIQALPAASRPANSVSPIGPERSRSVDAGVEQGLWSGRVRARATIFDNQFSDLIEFVSAGALPQLGIPASVAAATGYGAYVNSESYWARGVELSAETAIGRWLRLRGGYTYLHAVVTQSFASSALEPAFNPAFPTIPIGAYGPLVGAAPFRHPAHTANLLAILTKGRAQVAVAGYFTSRSDDSTFLSDAYGGNTLLLPNHDLDPAYQKIDLSASFEVLPRVRWYISVENAVNEHYEAAFGYPALPRSVRTGVKATFGGNHR